MFRIVRRCTVIAAFICASGGARADQPLFDAHLHYNMEPRAHLPLDQVLDLFERNGVRGILANSRPNDGTHALVDAHPPHVRVVPFIRPYRVLADVRTWFRDPTTLDLIESEFRRGGFVGVGEFHLQGQDAAADVVRRTVDFARRNKLWLLAHCDLPALEILFGHDPEARIIWAHTGFSLPVGEVERELERRPGLLAELSYRSGIVDPNGKLDAEWDALFRRRPDRFLIGSDTWVDERWDAYAEIAAGYRRWLDQLPSEVSRQIAIGNAERIFGPMR